MTDVKIAVIGAGLIGREHCQLIADAAGATLAGIADNGPAGQFIADKFKVPLFDDYRQMLDQLRPDGAIVALPNQLHAAAGIACAERHIPCLVEKPVTDTLANARALVAAGARYDVPLLVGHHRRHSPDISGARALIAKGEIGPLMTVNGMWWAKKPDDYFNIAWRREPGGGPILINLIHEIDSLRFIAGEIAEVYAFTGHQARGAAVEDTAAVTLRFANGALGSFVISDAVPSPYTWEFTSGHALYFPSQPGDHLWFGGRAGSLAVPSLTRWAHADIDQSWHDPIIAAAQAKDATSPYVGQLKHFMAVIRGQADPLIDADDAMRTLAVTLAVERSGRDGRPVPMAEMLADENA